MIPSNNKFPLSVFVNRKGLDRIYAITGSECNHEDGTPMTLGEQAAVISHYFSLKDKFEFARSYEKKALQLIEAWKRTIFGEQLNPVKRGIVADNFDLTLSYLFNDVSSSPFPPEKTPRFTFIDLFAGIGGFRMAFQNLGGECVFSSEWDEQAQRTYYANYGEMPFGDITKESTKQMIPDNFDVLCAGFPCQAFSLAGKRRGFAETRGTLFFDVAEILRRKQPKAFFLENVKGLAIHDKGKTLETILNTLDEVGYVVPDPQIVNAMYYGVPQHRERIYIVGFRKDLGISKDDFQYPTHNDKIPCWLDVREDEPVPAKYYLSETYVETLRRHRARHEAAGHGFGYKIIPDDGVANAIVCGGMGRECNLVKDFRQTDLIPTTNIKGEINKEGIRKMTPREWARLQGYPDTFKIVVADASAYKQFGNSVAVPAIQATAKKLLDTLNFSGNENVIKGKFKANKGEWSELYVLYKLLSDRKIHEGDIDTQKLPDAFYPVLDVIRTEIAEEGDRIYKYSIENNRDYKENVNKSISIYEDNKLVLKLSSEDFTLASKRLYFDIVKGSGPSFCSSIKNEEFMEKIHCQKIKRSADHKDDITVNLYNLIERAEQETGFSVKSMIGNPPTLLNCSDATLITFVVKGYDFNQDEINHINGIEGNAKLKRRLKAITARGANIEFKDYANNVFRDNLLKIDDALPSLLAEMVFLYFTSYNVNSIEEITKKIIKNNPRNYKSNDIEKYYIDKIQKLLLASALGMYPNTQYNNDDDAKGYIVVRNDGDLVCYHIIKTKLIKQHLYKNTKFDTPASTKIRINSNSNIEKNQRTPYCVLYKNKNTGDFEIQLNFQIRWK